MYGNYINNLNDVCSIEKSFHQMIDLNKSEMIIYRSIQVYCDESGMFIRRSIAIEAGLLYIVDGGLLRIGAD